MLHFNSKNYQTLIWIFNLIFNSLLSNSVWTQELNKDQLVDGERHLSSDIELPEYSEEDDEDIEETENAADKEEKDADYEDDEITEAEKNRKKSAKKGNKNRNSKKKDRNKWVFNILK